MNSMKGRWKAAFAGTLVAATLGNAAHAGDGNGKSQGIGLSSGLLIKADSILQNWIAIPILERKKYA